MSSLRKNKRDLTSRTVDILNGVNNTGTNPQSRSKPRFRRLPSQPINQYASRTLQDPHSDDLWEIPDVFEETRPTSKRRAAETEPRSPRRSQRARKPVQVENTPTRASRRLRMARMVESRRKEGSEEGSDEGSEEDHSERGEELNEIIDQRLGSGLMQLVNENRSTNAKQGVIDEETSEQEDEGRRASEEPREITSPSKKRKSRRTDAQQAQEDDSEYAPDTAASEEADGTGSDTTRPESTHIIQTRRLIQELASPRATRRHTLAGQAAEQEAEESSRRPTRRSLPVQNGLRAGKSTRDKQGDTMAELSEVPESAGDESESESSYESEAEEEEEEEEEPAASQHLPDTQREEPSITARPSKRRRTDQYQRNPQVEVLRTQPTPPPMHSNPSTPDDNQSRRRPRVPSESPAIAIRSISAISDDAQTKEVAEDKAWLTEASNIGQQNDNWGTLVDEAKKLKGKINPSQPKSFREIDKQLSKLLAKYKKIKRRLRSEQSPVREDLRECEHLREAIFKEAKEILDEIWEISLPERQAESKAFLKSALQLIEQFEARVFPIMIHVILLCFEAYYTNQKLFPSAYRHHLSKSMKLLLHFCNRITNIRICNKIPSMRTVGYMKSEKHSETIFKALQELIKALEDHYNSVQRRVDGTDRASRGTERREWTEDEGIALLDGLKLFLGEDRYECTIRHFRRRLRHRSLQELRTKALEIHDRYIPLIQDDLRTAEGCRQWQWLLSVADDQRPVSVD